jgi:hypothetical protein
MTKPLEHRLLLQLLQEPPRCAGTITPAGVRHVLFRAFFPLVALPSEEKPPQLTQDDRNPPDMGSGMDHLTGIPLRVELLRNPGALTRLSEDLAHTSEVYVLAFHLDPTFFMQLFASALERGRILVIANHSQTSKLRAIMRECPNLIAYSWSKNRLFHSKVVCLPQLGVTHIGSHNLTRYSYTIAQNFTVRLESVHHCDQVMTAVRRMIRRAVALDPEESPKPAA